MSSIKSVVQRLFGKYIILTNSVAIGSLLATGDILEQQVLQRWLQKNREGPLPMDWGRPGRMFLLGFICAPVPTYWYRYLDRFLPSRAGNTVIKKVVLDQVLGSPVIYFLYFFGAGMLERQTLQSTVQEFKQKFLPVYVADWVFWFPAQTINFRYVSPQYRVVYMGVLAQIWTVFLSWMKHEFGKEDKKENDNEKHKD